MFHHRIVALIIISLVLLGCSRDRASIEPPSPDVVASFNGGIITKAQLDDKFESFMPCCKGRYEGMEGRKVLIKELALPQVISQAIKQKKIDLRGNIREKLGNLTDELNVSFLHMKFHEQILRENEAYKDLKENYEFQRRRLEGLPLSERYPRLVQIHEKLHHEIAKEVETVSKAYINNLRKEAAITKNLEALRVPVTRMELKDFYRRHKEGLHADEYRVPEKIKVQELKIEIEKSEKDCPTCIEEMLIKARDKAESALTELRSGTPFQTVTESYASKPEDSTNPKWIVRNDSNAIFGDDIFSLEIGEISRVIEKDNNFYIVKVLVKKTERFKSFEEIIEPLTREYRWQKADDHLKNSRDTILFTINSKPYTIGDFADEYTETTPEHKCHHMDKHETQETTDKKTELCELSHNDFEEQKQFADRMIDKELIAEDTYNQMIHVEHKEEIEFLTMTSLYPIFHKEEMAKLIHVTDKMVEDYYEEHQKEYRYPAKAKLSMIVINGGEEKEKKQAAFEKAMTAYKEVKPSFFTIGKGKDFAEIARKYSEDPETAPKGGRLDVDIYECRNEVEYMLLHGFHKKIFSLEPGDISDVFEFENNFYIVQVREMQSRKKATFEEIRDRVKQDLTNKEHQKVMENWEDDLLKTANFVVYENPLEEALVASEEAQETKES
jgi:parvulin-like peptidyl-prolyl isomerase